MHICAVPREHSSFVTVVVIVFVSSSRPLHPYSCADPDGGDRGSVPSLKFHKNIGFLSNTGPHPFKITKLPIQHAMLGHHRPASETPFKWHLNGVSLAGR